MGEGILSVERPDEIVDVLNAVPVEDLLHGQFRWVPFRKKVDGALAVAYIDSAPTMDTIPVPIYMADCHGKHPGDLVELVRTRVHDANAELLIYIDSRRLVEGGV